MASHPARGRGPLCLLIDESGNPHGSIYASDILYAGVDPSPEAQAAKHQELQEEAELLALLSVADIKGWQEDIMKEPPFQFSEDQCAWLRRLFEVMHQEALVMCPGSLGQALAAWAEASGEYSTDPRADIRAAIRKHVRIFHNQCCAPRA